MHSLSLLFSYGPGVTEEVLKGCKIASHPSIRLIGFVTSSSCLLTEVMKPIQIVVWFQPHCILVDSPTVICWSSPFVILGVLSLFSGFYYIFDGKSC